MKITAAVTPAKSQPFSLATLDLDDPRDDEVLVRVVATGLCHTDLVCRDQAYPVPLPAVLGHEGAGIVERVGARVTKVVPGDPVVPVLQHLRPVPQLPGRRHRLLHGSVRAKLHLPARRRVDDPGPGRKAGPWLLLSAIVVCHACARDRGQCGQGAPGRAAGAARPARLRRPNRCRCGDEHAQPARRDRHRRLRRRLRRAVRGDGGPRRRLLADHRRRRQAGAVGGSARPRRHPRRRPGPCRTGGSDPRDRRRRWRPLFAGDDGRARRLPPGRGLPAPARRLRPDRGGGAGHGGHVRHERHPVRPHHPRGDRGRQRARPVHPAPGRAAHAGTLSLRPGSSASTTSPISTGRRRTAKPVPPSSRSCACRVETGTQARGPILRLDVIRQVTVAGSAILGPSSAASLLRTDGGTHHEMDRLRSHRQRSDTGRLGHRARTPRPSRLLRHVARRSGMDLDDPRPRSHRNGRR